MIKNKSSMSNLKMSFVDAASTSPTYTLKCKNNSSANWIFYVYQTLPQQPADIFSLAWFASPYYISKGSTIEFSWQIDYSFVWGNSGSVSPGVTFYANGIEPCSPASQNITTFSLDDNAPQFSPATAGGQKGSLSIYEASNVPNGTFATGIGMSGYGTFVQQALANTTQVYTPNPMYWIAAATQMQMGVVLAQTVSHAASVKFANNVYTVNAELGDDNRWTIS